MLVRVSCLGTSFLAILSQAQLALSGLIIFKQVFKKFIQKIEVCTDVHYTVTIS